MRILSRRPTTATAPPKSASSLRVAETETAAFSGAARKTSRVRSKRPGAREAIRELEDHFPGESDEKDFRKRCRQAAIVGMSEKDLTDRLAS